MVGVSVLLASFIAVVCANPIGRSSMVVHESRASTPVGFAHIGAAPPDATLNLRIALTSKDKTGLEKALMDVSDPASKNYGNHLSKDEVETFIKPSQSSLDAVNQFLSSNGIEATTLSPAGDWLGFSVPVSKANALFDAEFATFTHIKTGQQYTRTLSYSIPASLKGHLDLVHPTVTFENPIGGGRLPVVTTPLIKKRSLNSTSALDACGDSEVTPACLQSLYGIPTAKATQSSNQIGVSALAGEYADPNDLKQFLSSERKDLDPNTKFAVQTLDGGSNSPGDGTDSTEPNLDIQYTVGLASGVPVTYIAVGSQTQDGQLQGFLDLANFLLAESKPPQVLTTSYGWDETSMSPALADKMCNAFAQLGARGVSVLFASGDGGVAGGHGEDHCTAFVPAFPSGCPYLTSVGATVGTGPETAANFSSGGFSNIWTAPSYQTQAVQGYIKNLGNTYSGKYNATGRAFPDVSAQGVNVMTIVGGQDSPASGTSCSSPIFASVIGLLNDELIAAGKKPLGFLNPFLYSNGAAALTDVTSGTNPGCDTQGFSATAGWDPVTGLGTPNFAKLKSAVGL